jgi:uncharacterized YccA/Bax inhibitor family protein
MAFDDSTNPTLRSKTFDIARSDAAAGTMTMTGAINRAGILLLILMASSAFAWSQENPGLLMVGAIGGLIAAIVLSFKPALAPWLAPTYAAVEGLAIGTLSVMTERSYPGIPGNAMALTFGTLAVMLMCYRAGILRATPMFMRVIMFATFAIMLTYMVNMIMSFFGASIPMIHDASPLGIGFSVVVTLIAAFNLIIDFDMFERNARGAPKYMEWYCGFALLTTLVWLYVEILRLLSKLNRR